MILPGVFRSRLTYLSQSVKLEAGQHLSISWIITEDQGWMWIICNFRFDVPFHFCQNICSRSHLVRVPGGESRPGAVVQCTHVQCTLCTGVHVYRTSYCSPGTSPWRWVPPPRRGTATPAWPWSSHPGCPPSSPGTSCWDSETYKIELWIIF